ncbi:SWIM zinc finger family protein [Amycolatopsis sp. NPDC051071]|uniref:SWIM zinc finger family protein n=1 Tax=Amycolatopsis sp. NPDC051071 TaxID=3154637 RepID=UPI0034465B88
MTDGFRQALDELGVHKGLVPPCRVDTLTIGPGAAVASVRVTRQRFYEVRIGLPTFGKQVWTAVTAAVVDDEVTRVAMLDGRVPEDIERFFAAEGVPLFPEQGELSLDCTCPGTRVPCDHLVAALIALADEADTDPFAILAFRGRERTTLLEEIGRQAGARVTAPPSDAETPGLDEVMEDFFGWGPAGDVTDKRRPPAGDPLGLLDEVPPLKATVDGTSVTALLRPLYRVLTGHE